MKNIKDKLSKIDKDHYQILVDIGKVAHEEKQKAYLVGGMIRDLLLGFDNLDIDIVVESNAKQLAEALVKEFPNCELSAKHDKFHTAKLIFNINRKKVPIDLASTRQETYEHSAALPKVKVSDLKNDLYRRDFTINALAVSLLPNEFGEVVDLFDGLIDLNNKKIRVLHDLSFIDDPTRMIRAIRFAAKLGFEVEEHTQKLMKEAIESKQFDNLIEKIRGDRVKIEIRYLFNLPNVKDAVKAFLDSGIYRMISVELKQCRGVPWHALTNATQNNWLIILAIIIKDLSDNKQNQIMKNFQMTTSEIKIIKAAYSTFDRLKKLLENNQTIDSVIVYRELNGLQIESVSIAKMLFAVETPCRGVSTMYIGDLINEFINKTSKIKLEITGDDLIKMGVKGGKKVGEILDKVLELKIKNPKMSKSDELNEAKNLT